MTVSAIQYYCAELRSVLLATLTLEDVEEVVTETSNRLAKRADELRATGLSVNEAEEKAIQEPGSAEEIARTAANDYAPVPSKSRDPNRRLPERSLAFQLLAAAAFSCFGRTISPYAGLEFASFILVGFAGAAVPGAMTSALQRLKYPRMSLAPSLVRCAIYGLVTGSMGATCLLVLDLTGHAFARVVYPFSFVSYALDLIGYGVMMAGYSNGTWFHLLRKFTRQKTKS